MMRYILASVFMVALAVNVSAAENRNMSYGDVVSRLYDMKVLATKPQAGEKSGSFSSGDRAAKYNEQTGLYENWFANADNAGVIASDGTFLDLKGPGVIWRIWSAQPRQGTIEFYVDGVTTPTFTTPFHSLFTENEKEFPQLAHVRARGWNSFIPVPFNTSLRIRGAEGWGNYYQITYTVFSKDTHVPSFTGITTEEQKAALKTANAIWAKRGPKLFVSEKAQCREVTLDLAPGEEKLVACYEAPAAISSFVMKRPFDFSHDKPAGDPAIAREREASVRILRELAISMTWDNDTSASVWSPLGDFFGTGAGENLHRTLAVGMMKDVYYSNWYMPFKRAVIQVKNEGTVPRNLSFTIHTEPLEKSADDLLRYHFKWHRDDFSGFDEKRLWTDRWPDWPVLKVDGAEGRFCGFTAHIWNPLHAWNLAAREKGIFSIPEKLKEGTPNYDFFMKNVPPPKSDYWWGEGDEKFFVDGEKMPSTYGTGSEDYFGYAWGTSLAFDSALQTQPRNGAANEIDKGADKDGPGNVGHITVARWQIPDNIPFNQSFEAVMEKYHGNNWPLLNAYGVSWYQTAGKADYYKEVPVKERVDYYLPAPCKPPVPVVNGRLEGEHLSHIDVLDTTRGGPHKVQNMSEHGTGWSNDAERNWLAWGPKHNSFLCLQFEVKEAVDEFSVGATYGPKNGIFDFYLDEQKIGGPVDFYARSYNREKDHVFNISLKPGTHVLKVVAVGWHPEVEKLKKNLNFGLDYIQLGKNAQKL